MSALSELEEYIAKNELSLGVPRPDTTSNLPAWKTNDSVLNDVDDLLHSLSAMRAKQSRTRRTIQRFADVDELTDGDDLTTRSFSPTLSPALSESRAHDSDDSLEILPRTQREEPSQHIARSRLRHSKDIFDLKSYIEPSQSNAANRYSNEPTTEQVDKFERYLETQNSILQELSTNIRALQQNLSSKAPESSRLQQEASTTSADTSMSFVRDVPDQSRHNSYTNSRSGLPSQPLSGTIPTLSKSVRTDASREITQLPQSSRPVSASNVLRKTQTVRTSNDSLWRPSQANQSSWSQPEQLSSSRGGGGGGGLRMISEPSEIGFIMINSSRPPKPQRQQQLQYSMRRSEGEAMGIHSLDLPQLGRSNAHKRPQPTMFPQRQTQQFSSKDNNVIQPQRPRPPTSEPRFSPTPTPDFDEWRHSPEKAAEAALAQSPYQYERLAKSSSIHSSPEAYHQPLRGEIPQSYSRTSSRSASHISGELSPAEQERRLSSRISKEVSAADAAIQTNEYEWKGLQQEEFRDAELDTFIMPQTARSSALHIDRSTSRSNSSNEDIPRSGSSFANTMNLMTKTASPPRKVSIQAPKITHMATRTAPQIPQLLQQQQQEEVGPNRRHDYNQRPVVNQTPVGILKLNANNNNSYRREEISNNSRHDNVHPSDDMASEAQGSSSHHTSEHSVFEHLQTSTAAASNHSEPTLRPSVSPTLPSHKQLYMHTNRLLDDEYMSDDSTDEPPPASVTRWKSQHLELLKDMQKLSEDIEHVLRGKQHSDTVEPTQQKPPRPQQYRRQEDETRVNHTPGPLPLWSTSPVRPPCDDESDRASAASKDSLTETVGVIRAFLRNSEKTTT